MALLESSLQRLGARWPKSAIEAIGALGVERARLRVAQLAARRPRPMTEAQRRKVKVFQAVATGLGSVDPLRAEQRRCQRLGEAAVRDAACLEVWAETRDRFLGRTPSDPVRRDNESQ